MAHDEDESANVDAQIMAFLHPNEPAMDLYWSDGMYLRNRHRDWVHVAVPRTPQAP